MKKINAIIRSSKFKEVRKALNGVGVNFFTFMEVKGFGQQKGEKVVYRGSVYDLGYIARLKLEIITTDDKVDAILTAITNAGKTGEVGDGKIIVSPIEKVIRIRTGDEGEAAL